MSFEYSTRVAVLAGVLTLGGNLAVQGRQSERPAYLNPDLPAAARAADLVSRMTLDEKISQLTNDAAAIPRLGVPAYEWCNECLHVVPRAAAATVSPQAIGLAASSDVPLLPEVAGVISDEARAKHPEFERR